jgi:hypothetical protein
MERGAAHRADAILRHMEKRHADGAHDIRPDVIAYNTVMKAWTRSRDNNALRNAQGILQRMEKEFEAGNDLARPNVISYNIIIDGLAKSRETKSLEHAMSMIQTMKRQCRNEGNGDCQPDVFTYTSLVNGLAERSVPNGLDIAEALVKELEEEYQRTRKPSLKPNVRTYTALIHVIARNRTMPERALEIVDRLESLDDILLDVGCYNALINAFGWSKVRGRGRQAYNIMQKMLRLYQSGINKLAKPDVITCNSVINACAYETAETNDDKAELVRIAVDTLELFQSKAPNFGNLNHISYANVLLAISNHMARDEKQFELAEATFWNCCKGGHASVLVITQLNKALSWDRFSRLLGPALQSTEGEPLGFNWRKLPTAWTHAAPKPSQRAESRPSRRHPSTKVTKSFITSPQRPDTGSR